MLRTIFFLAAVTQCGAFVAPSHVATHIRSGSRVASTLSQRPATAQMSLGDKMTRRALTSVAASLAAAQLSVREATAAGVDYKAVAADIDALVKADPDKGPTLVRLAWHTSGTYDKMSKDGGSGPGTMRFQDELAHGGNAGLYKAVAWMEPIKQAHPGISYGDLYTMSGVVAIKSMKGPAIPWSAGRKDGLEKDVTPDGRLPNADMGPPSSNAQHLRDIFYRMGFDDQEIVALSGAHALGRCHPDASGYTGPWSPTPTTWSNSYFGLLLNIPWTLKEWDGPMQFEDPSGALMMLPSDIVLLQDRKFRKYTVQYSKDAKKFDEDFVAAFQKLEELGCKGLKKVELFA